MDIFAQSRDATFLFETLTPWADCRSKDTLADSAAEAEIVFRPDLTEMVDWALKTNYLLTYLTSVP